MMQLREETFFSCQQFWQLKLEFQTESRTELPSAASQRFLCATSWEDTQDDSTLRVSHLGLDTSPVWINLASVRKWECNRLMEIVDKVKTVWDFTFFFFFIATCTAKMCMSILKVFLHYCIKFNILCSNACSNIGTPLGGSVTSLYSTCCQSLLIWSSSLNDEW